MFAFKLEDLGGGMQTHVAWAGEYLHCQPDVVARQGGGRLGALVQVGKLSTDGHANEEHVLVYVYVCVC